jgi:two-component sensor histidine kinase
MDDWQQSHDDTLMFRWTEVGGPPLRPPERFGQGCEMIAKTAEHLKARAHFDWRPEGLVFEFSAPVTLLVAQPEVAALN